ncbi:MAG: TRAP transporter large permease subunit, partial [Rhodospirillaceae bacterium]|nr:TRAP transporter large permease subunit [Rhodospirillaceae bacterium]
GGTLGILIPPSINLIIYGLLTDTSVPELYLAGIFPGLTLAVLFMAVVVIACLFRPKWDGDKIETSWATRIRVLPDLLPPVLLFVAVVGSIYAGVATPTEAASIGVVFALMIAAWNKALNLEMLKQAFEGTMRSSAMIMLIILAAVFLNFVLGFMGITQTMLESIEQLGWTPMQTMVVIICFYLLLGMFMETLSMMLTTIPVVFPIVVHMGFDPVWFGIMITVLMEAALITPPIGINLYVVHGIRARGGNFNDVSIGAIPFLFAMFAMIALLLFYPNIAIWLPNQFY